MNQKRRRKPKLQSSSQSNWLYGKNPIFEVLKASKRKVLEVSVTAEFLKSSQNQNLLKLLQKKRVTISEVPSRDIEKRVGPVVHQNIMAHAEPYPYQTFAEVLENLPPKNLILALDEITDPQNFATLCRSALAFGVKTILIPKDRSVTVTPTVCKASSGAVEYLQIVQVVNLARALEQLKKADYWIYGTSLTENSQNLRGLDPAQKTVLVMGSEGKGLRPLVEKTCDILVKISMASDFDSLNVAQAATVCLYELANKIGMVDG